MWTIETLRKIASKKGWVLNPDADVVRAVLDGLIKNHEKYGRYYCPCRIIGKDPEREMFAKLICPCITATDDVENVGKCTCELFFREGS